MEGRELYQQCAATANEISGQVACSVYINEQKIALWSSISFSSFSPPSSARSGLILGSIGADTL